MRIALPVAGETLCVHFGHCEKFALVDVDQENKKIVTSQEVEAPPHQPGLLPTWLANHNVTMIIAGGMGQRAQELFDAHNIKVMVGVSSGKPGDIVQTFLDGKLEAGQNVCDH